MKYTKYSINVDNNYTPMNKAVINIKIDSQTKKQARKLAKAMGLSLSAVINRQLQQFIEIKQINFSAPYRMSKKLEKELGPIMDDIKKGRNLSKGLRTPEEIESYFAEKWR